MLVIELLNTQGAGGKGVSNFQDDLFLCLLEAKMATYLRYIEKMIYVFLTLSEKFIFFSHY